MNKVIPGSLIINPDANRAIFRILTPRRGLPLSTVISRSYGEDIRIIISSIKDGHGSILYIISPKYTGWQYAD